MNFKQIQDAVLADAFDETDRAQAMNWINVRYAQVWNLHEWTFTRGTANVTVTSGSNIVTGLPADFAVALDLFRADGGRLVAYEEYRLFANDYLGTDNASTGRPQAFTVLNGQILVGPTSSETSSAYLLPYEKAPTLLAADGDIPSIPAEHHYMLVTGGKAEGFAAKTILLGSFEQLWQQSIQAMERKYLTAVRGAPHQTPAYRPGGWFGLGVRTG